MAIEFSIVSGALPPGLIGTTVGDSFVISGTPTAAGNFSFRLRAERENGTFVEKDYVLNALAIAAGSLPDATNGQPYTATPTLTGDAAGALTWSATGLPPGLAINPDTGEISGTPTSTGSFSFNVTASDSLGCIAQVEGAAEGGTIDIEVLPEGACVIDNPSDLGSFSLGAVHDIQFTQTGLVGAVTWSATGPFHPNFLNVMNFGGTPGLFRFQSNLFVGTVNFDVRVEEDADPSNFCEKEFSLFMECPVDAQTGIENLSWNCTPANVNGSVTMSGGDGLIDFVMNDPAFGSSGVCTADLCVPSLGYLLEYEFDGTVSLVGASATVSIEILHDGIQVHFDSEVVNSSGPISLIGSFALSSNTFYEIRVTGILGFNTIGESLNATVELRPLTPP